MTNDILEQITEDYFRAQGYFTQQNIKYRPNNSGVHSDIDILGIHPSKKGVGRVIAVSCKSWGEGLRIKRDLKIFEKDSTKKISGKEYWKIFREIADPTGVWSNAFKEKVQKLTGQKTFSFYLAVTHCRKSNAEEKQKWENFKLFHKNLKDCPIKIMELKTMINDLYQDLDQTPSHSELSRLLQLIKAAGGSIKY